MTDQIKQAWLAHEETRRALNIAVRAKFHVGQPVKVRWGPKWVDATVNWVPYENGPAFNHIYVMIPGHKMPKKYEMDGGVFQGIRTGDFDGVSL